MRDKVDEKLFKRQILREIFWEPMKGSANI